MAVAGRSASSRRRRRDRRARLQERTRRAPEQRRRLEHQRLAALGRRAQASGGGSGTARADPGPTDRHGRRSLRPLRIPRRVGRQPDLQPGPAVPTDPQPDAALQLLDQLPRTGHELHLRHRDARLLPRRDGLLSVPSGGAGLFQLRHPVQHGLHARRQRRAAAGEGQVLHRRLRLDADQGLRHPVRLL
ncbi:hypothetical protein D3C87_1226930 [compost metagenome]